MFACPNGTCIEKSKIKDNIIDCDDGIDETKLTYCEYKDIF